MGLHSYSVFQRVLSYSHIHALPAMQGVGLLIRASQPNHHIMSALSHSHKITPMPQGVIWGSVSCPRTLRHAAGARERITDPLISGQPALPPEPQLPHMFVCCL